MTISLFVVQILKLTYRFKCAEHFHKPKTNTLNNPKADPRYQIPPQLSQKSDQKVLTIRRAAEVQGVPVKTPI